ARKLDALRLPTRERGRRLSDLQIAHPHLFEQQQGGMDVRMGGEELTRFADGQPQNIGDVLAAVAYFQRGLIEALALALVAGDVNVGQEVHLHLAYAVALARLATAAFGVEGEAPGRVPTRARLR